MPILLNPNQKYPICLETDKDLPENERPIFFAKAQSCLGQNEIGELVDRWSDDGSDLTRQQLFDEAIELLSNVIVGWKNMRDPATGEPIPFDQDSIREWLTYLEVRELIRKVMFNSHVDFEAKKNLESPPLSGEENSVPLVVTTSV